MRYQSFHIKNFKGIKDTVVDLRTSTNVGVFCFVGLNESGKTTILEAIHSFSPDPATSELVSGEEDTGIPYTQRVPRHLISEFSGDVSVTATAIASEEERNRIIRAIKTEHKFDVDEDFPSQFIFERHQRFENGDFQISYFSLRNNIKIKSEKQRKFREPTLEERHKIKMTIYGFTPDIAYFPTFVFDFPERVFLTERGGILDAFYRRVFQDILDYDDRGHTIAKDITRRIREKKFIVPWLSFLSAWNQTDDRAKIQHVMDRAGAAVTKLVFGRWNQIFGEDTKGKEVIISSEIDEGEVTDEKGNKTKTQNHDVYISFQIRDGTRRFNVNDRSLGFRWFFSFMLFTQFRVARKSTRALLFLFDEPASNLHAAAQQKLIDSFPEITKGEHSLIYTTHSHYMVEPKWLEQTFIVTNYADTPQAATMLDAISLDDESLDVRATTYRAFVNANPTSTNYFQPILDRLEVVPSQFDIRKDSMILEGKSDYYILRYSIKLLSIADLPLLPGLGAGTLGALIALQIGWGLNFLFVLDGDRQGRFERDRYINEFGVTPERISTIDDFNPNSKKIEDVLDAEALTKIQTALGLSSKPSKGQILRFFQERLASNNVEELGPFFTEATRRILDGMKSRLTQLKTGGPPPPRP